MNVESKCQGACKCELSLSCFHLLRALRLTEGGETPLSRCGVAWGIYSISTVLALYTSFSTVTMILAQVLFLVIHKRGRVTSRTGVFSVTTLGVSAVLFLPWALALYRHWEAFQISMRWSRERGWDAHASGLGRQGAGSKSITSPATTKD